MEESHELQHEIGDKFAIHQHLLVSMPRFLSSLRHHLILNGMML